MSETESDGVPEDRRGEKLGARTRGRLLPFFLSSGSFGLYPDSIRAVFELQLHSYPETASEESLSSSGARLENPYIAGSTCSP